MLSIFMDKLPSRWLTNPETIIVYKHAFLRHLLWSPASAVFAILTCSVHIKSGVAVEVLLAALALVTSAS
jgi:hypothetical protein